MAEASNATLGAEGRQVDQGVDRGEDGAAGEQAEPAGAPKVVVVLVDDMGVGASSAFGGPCQMPPLSGWAELP